MSNDSELELSDDQSESGETLYERTNIIVDRGQEPMRLDKFLTARIEGASRNKVQQAIETGRVLVNNKKVQANHKIKPGEEIVVYSDREVHSEEIIPEQMSLNIVYEDDEVMIVNKPVGLVVHPASGNDEGQRA
jgi:23S rRNA pseudouridine1911/1915/1917 synthase